MPKIFDAGGTFDLSSLAALARRSRVFVGWSGGACHLAAAMSTPVVVLRSDQTNDSCEADEPRGVPHRLLKSDATPETIAQAARELIGL